MSGALPLVLNSGVPTQTQLDASDIANAQTAQADLSLQAQFNLLLKDYVLVTGRVPAGLETQLPYALSC